MSGMRNEVSLSFRQVLHSVTVNKLAGHCTCGQLLGQSKMPIRVLYPRLKDGVQLCWMSDLGIAKNKVQPVGYTCTPDTVCMPVDKLVAAQHSMG